MVDLSEEFKENEEFYIRMQIKGLETELKNALGEIEQRKILNEIKMLRKELIELGFKENNK